MESFGGFSHMYIRKNGSAKIYYKTLNLILIHFYMHDKCGILPFTWEKWLLVFHRCYSNLIKLHHQVKITILSLVYLSNNWVHLGASKLTLVRRKTTIQTEIGDWYLRQCDLDWPNAAPMLEFYVLKFQLNLIASSSFDVIPRWIKFCGLLVCMGCPLVFFERYLKPIWFLYRVKMWHLLNSYELTGTAK